MSKKKNRLPSHIIPQRYELMVKPDLENFIFEGQESIKLEIKKATKKITLHAKELKIEGVEFQTKTGKKLKGRVSYDIKKETAAIAFSKPIRPGNGDLKLVFKGILNDKMRGFYRSRYTHEGKEKHLATTQFEATDARRAFPCFDEPHQKAVFDVTLLVPKHLTAISNTIPINDPHPDPLPEGEGGIVEHESGYKVVKFAPTPKMSTYLLAFIVGEFEWIEGYVKSSGNVGNGRDRSLLVRVFTTPGKKHQAKFALDCAIRTLEFYNRYFDIPYPLPILDLIAIPDFAHGAMENWGAITYRESALLVDDEHTSAANKQWVALVIAHELAHQWFGNLVTMKWWTHLWLNEGFASYIEYLAVNHLFPKWDIWTQFAYNDLGVALKLDGLKNTHPIEIEVRHPDEIGEIFDEVSYSKGASIIRMLADYLGEKKFRNGLRYYLKKHAYSNAATGDLWRAFEKVSKKPVEKFMKNWTSKAGYPLVRIIERPDGLKFTQSRFFSSRVSRKQSKDNTVWQIPLKIRNPASVKTSAGRQELGIKNYRLAAKSRALKLKTEGWTKINFGENSFFRTDYPAQLLLTLKQPIKNKQLAPIDRLGIVRDAFALAESGQLPTAEALKLALAYRRESDYTVWVELAAGLDKIGSLLRGQKGYENFESFGREIFSQISQKLGFKQKRGERHTAKLLRSLALYHYGFFGGKTVNRSAKKIFWSGKAAPDIRALIYCLAAENGGQKEHKKLSQMYVQTELSEEKNRIGRALGYFKQEKLLSKTLRFAISKNVRYQDAPAIIISVFNNFYGRKMAWRFVKKNWALLLKRYGSGGHLLPRIIKAASGFASAADARAFEKFFKANRTPGCQRAVLQVLEKIYSNAAWLKDDLVHIQRWLKNRYVKKA